MRSTPSPLVPLPVRTGTRSRERLDQEVARSLEELATRLDVLAARPARARAYRELARRITRHRALTRATAAGALPTWLARDVDDLMQFGTCEALDEARVALPGDILLLAETPGVGPELARSLWRRSQVSSLAELAEIVRGGFLPRLPALGPRERAMLESLLPAPPSGMLLAVAVEAGRLVEEALRDAGARRASVVGETRRGEGLVGELEVLVTGIDARAISVALARADSMLLVRDVRSKGAEASCVLQGRGPLRVFTCAAPDYWYELVRRTGNHAHVAWLEHHARLAGHATLRDAARGARTEEHIYEKLGLAPVPPEARCGATSRSRAEWLADGAVRGAFHVHTDWSDGTSSIVAMAQAASRAGYEYLGISDHSRAAPYANGLDEGRLESQRAAMRRARAEVTSITLFHGIEVDILKDGSLDLPDEALANLDFVIASVHTDTRLDARAMTARLVRALSNPLVTMLGHPTGRLLSGKAGYAFDLDAVARAAAANDTWIEINANGHRLDLSPALARRAHAHGARFAINPDAHAIEGLHDVALGERIARRAGLPASAIVNTRDRRAMQKLLAERKKRALRLLRG